MINTKELKIATGASNRQIDYWCTMYIIKPIGSSSPGSGYKRYFDPAIIPKVRLLVNVSHAFGGVIHGTLLNFIYNQYEEGEINMENGISIHWDL